MFERFLSFIVPELLQIIVGVIGLVLIQTRLRNSHPRAHFYAAIGLTLLVVEGLVVAIALAYLFTEHVPEDGSVFANKASLLNIMSYLVTAAALASLLAALLANRAAIGRK